MIYHVSFRLVGSSAQIDKVRGIVETTRASTKAAQYETVIKRGDLLLEVCRS
ncbi:hypothetical protein JB92DRAFT_3022127 [Gautieria morchelliformis]|nr:hypothetical protein JB92DRAFT_3022127 [Gautieria morchelliformis]